MALLWLLPRASIILRLGIRTEAKEHGVVQVEIPPLARALYFTTDIDSTIPEELYYAVAQVIAYVFSLASVRRDRQTAGKPDPEIPPNFRFDLKGNRNNEGYVKSCLTIFL